MRKAFIAGLLASVACASAAIAQQGPTQAFDATYKTTGPAGQGSMRMVSDGHGKMRTETDAHGQKMITIMDYPNKTAWTIMEAQKMVMKVPLRPTQDVHDEASAKKANAKSLGSKVVAGHPCHGWQYSSDGNTTTVWTGDDIKYMVKTEVNTKSGQAMTNELVSFKSGAPSADNFVVPAGYKTMSIPGMK